MIFSLSCWCDFHCLKFLLLILLVLISLCCVPSSNSLGPTSSPRRDRTLSLSSSPCCTTSALTPSNTWSRWGVSPRPPRTWPSHSCFRTSTTPRALSVSCSRPSNTSWPISICNSVNSRGLKQSQPVVWLNYRGLKQSKFKSQWTHEGLEHSQSTGTVSTNSSVNSHGLKQSQLITT